jgi:soluble lytic murein transglycosylase
LAALAAALAGLALWGRGWRRRAENRRIVASAAGRLELAPELLLAVAEVESGFDDRARSEKGALGLLQVMPGTGRELAARLGLEGDLLDRRENALLGGAYLKLLLERYRRDLHLALAAYHAGPGRVDEWVQRGRGLPGPEVVETFGFQETRKYVDEVLRRKGVRHLLCEAP